MQDFLIIHTTTDSVKQVMDKLEVKLKEKGVKIFARINHGKAAEEVGLTMPPEEVLVFGNPQVGTTLMLENPAIGIELPLKVAAWQQGNHTQLAYQNLDKLKEIFGIQASINTIEILKKFMEQLINSVK